MYSAASLTASHSTAKAADPARAKKPGSERIPFEEDVWSFSPAPRTHPESSGSITQYPWRPAIVTTTFWIGEKPSDSNPVPNRKSCWDPRWVENYGGTDSPKRTHRRKSTTRARSQNHLPTSFRRGRELKQLGDQLRQRAGSASVRLLSGRIFTSAPAPSSGLSSLTIFAFDPKRYINEADRRGLRHSANQHGKRAPFRKSGCPM